MCTIRTGEGDVEEPRADDEGEDEDRAEVELPPPGDGAAGGEDDAPPALVELGVEPGEVRDESLGLVYIGQ